MAWTVLPVATATIPVTPERSLNPVPLNYASDWRVASEGPGEIVLSNIVSGVNEPLTLRIAFSEINDVFKGTKVRPNTTAGDLNRQGASVLVQLAGTAFDPAQSAANVQRFPWSAHLVLKLPYGAMFSGGMEADDVLSILNGLLGSVYEQGEGEPQHRLDALLRGALRPVAL